MELPPPADALVDSFNVLFTRGLHDLSKAEWAVVDRAEYLRRVGERKQQCTAFSHVVVRTDLANSRLPARGVPEHIHACATEVEGADRAPARLLGPSSRAPEIGRDDEAGDASDDSCSNASGSSDAHMREREEDTPEASIAVDPVHELRPVKMLQALQGNITVLEAHARTVIRQEQTARIEDENGVMQPVRDEGGRQHMESLILDVQSTARSVGQAAQKSVELAIAETDKRLEVCPAALAIPTQAPMDSFSPQTWPACYVEWWFGDGAPGLKRERPMLFEEVARRVIDIEEHAYSLSTDFRVYVPASKSRFNTPEIIAVLGDVIRRMRLLRGTKAAIGRKGFDADLKALASATSEEFMAAMNIAGPRESIGSASSRTDMPPKIRTALRTLLLSTSDVPGTEGRKRRLRFNGYANNLLWGAPSFFATPNFADTYNPLVKLLHDGPDKNSHIEMNSNSRFLACVTPCMPSLRRMREIVAADPRAQAKFFLLMSELHYRYIVGVDRLHIGRAILARPQTAVQDEVAASLQPCLAPGTTDVQVPLEAQGRGFTHGHGKGHSVIGSTMHWLRRAVKSGLTVAVVALRAALIAMAETVQYDAAREPGRQLGVELRLEPFSARQQRQSRMDGGQEVDRTQRMHVELAPPVEQPHIEKERNLAAAECRLPRLGSAAYRDVPLTCAFQATFPGYRQRHTFGELGDVAQLASAEPSWASRRMGDIFSLDEDSALYSLSLSHSILTFICK